MGTEQILATCRGEQPMTNRSIQLTEKQVHDLDNAKCELYQVVQSLKDVVKPVHLREINNAIVLIDFLLKPTYKAEAAALRNLHKQVSHLEEGSMARWSVNEGPAEQICEGPVRFVRSSGWARSNEITYKSEVINNPTCGDAFQAFKQSIDVTGDTHHVFFEGVERIGAIDNVTIYSLLSGS